MCQIVRSRVMDPLFESFSEQRRSQATTHRPHALYMNSDSRTNRNDNGVLLKHFPPARQLAKLSVRSVLKSKFYIGVIKIGNKPFPNRKTENQRVVRRDEYETAYIKLLHQRPATEPDENNSYELLESSVCFVQQ